MFDSVVIVVSYAIGVGLVALVWISKRRHDWELKWLAKWAHSASPRIDLELPPPNLGGVVLDWAVGFKRWSQKLQQDLVKMRNERELAAESGAQNERFHARLRHDLRTPLNAMMGFSDLLLQGIDGPLEEQDTRVIETISETSRTLHRRVEEVLTDSIGIALVDGPEELDEPPSLRFSGRPAVAYPSPPSWLPRVPPIVFAVSAGILFVSLVVLAWRSHALPFAFSLSLATVAGALGWRLRTVAQRIRRQAAALREDARERQTSVDTLDEALRSFELRAENSRERETTATHFLAERDRKRNHRIARSAATLRVPLDEICSRTTNLLQQTSLNTKQRESLDHVLRSAHLLTMALEELFLLVDYENETEQAEPCWVPTVELVTGTITRLRKGFGPDVRFEVVVMPGIAPLYVDAVHFAVAFAGLMRFVLKRTEGAGVSVVVRSNARHVSFHFQEQRIVRHDTVPGRREQELSVLNSGPKLMKLVMERMAGECRYQLEGELEGWLVFHRPPVRP